MSIIYDLSRVPQHIVEQIHASPKYTKWFSEFPTKLFNRDNNAKTVKGRKLGVSTLVDYLLPHKLSGYQVCAAEVLAQCGKPCLNTAGRGAMTSTQMSRLRKTLMFFQYRDEFIAMMKREVMLHIAYCKKHNYEPAVRPNGTSDIRWELYIWDFMVETHKLGVQWYDYTKLANRLVPDPNVYDLTFSYSGVDTYQKSVETARAMGMRFAVVWRYKTSIPKSFMGMDVVSGDDDDLTYLSPQGTVRALYAKGKAVHDQSGFVIDC